MELRWDRLNWQDIKRLASEGYDTVLFPVGTIEAHGCIPLGTDNIIPETIAQRIAPEIKALIAPTVNYGVTNSLLAYPGSLTVKSETMTNYIAEILLSMVQSGMNKIIVLNGHGGHLTEIKNAANMVHHQTRAKIMVVHWWILCAGIEQKHYGKTGGHAALDETAAIIACAPETVQSELYDPSMHYRMRSGTNVYPNGSTILTYDDNAGDLDFDQAKASAYFDDVCVKVKETILETLQFWSR